MSFVNVTIDDQIGDEVTGAQITYTPAKTWNQGNGCSVCMAKVDASQAFNGTWHDASRFPGDAPLVLSFNFTGTAVYLFNILQNATLTDVNVTIDGQFTSRFTDSPHLPDSDTFAYNVPVFSADTLPFGEHTVAMSASGPVWTLVLFDYAIYTTTEAGSSPSPSAPPVSSASFKQGTLSTPPSNPLASSSAVSLPSLSSLSSSHSTALSPVQTASVTVAHFIHQINIAALVAGITGGVFLVLFLGWLLYRRRHPSKASLLRTTQHTDPGQRPAPSFASSSSRLMISEDAPEDDYPYSPNSVIAQVGARTSLLTTEHHELAAGPATNSGPLRQKPYTSAIANAHTHGARSLHAGTGQQHQDQQSLVASSAVSASGSDTRTEATTSVEAELRHQISVLRMENEQMRMQQDMEMESLPGYSSPLPSYRPRLPETS
ncbi:hypothetical protein BDW22DRAFT_1425073 [Trametopsis cervina]|nr:hypothetical protein BDW22DRAFT_1425073 [Trametopsis cervina]